MVQYIQAAADRGVRAQTGAAGEQLELTGGPAPGLHRYQRCHAEDHLTAAGGAAAGRAAAGSHAGCIAGAPSRAEYLDGRAQPGPLAGLTGRRLPTWPGLQVPPRGLADRGQAPGDDLPPCPTCRARRYRAVPGRSRGPATGSGDGRQARRQAPDAVG